MVPESHHKLLAHIRKTQERAKRKRKEASQENSEEESDDEFKSVKPKAERFVVIKFSYEKKVENTDRWLT